MLLQFSIRSQSESRPQYTRPNTGQQTYTSGPTASRGALPIEPDSSQKAFTHAKRPPRGVRQDKARLENARRASRQPARDTDVSRAKLTNNKVVRSQSVAGKQKLVQVTLWVDPAVKEHLERRAREEGLSLSPAGAAFLRTILQGSGRSAKANIMRRTPHISELISSVEQWMTEDRDTHGKKPV